MHIPQELHHNEQYFYTPPAAAALAQALASFAHPCVLCAPLVGAQLAELRRDVRVLDVDRRFVTIPGFEEWNIHRPTPLGESFGVIFCDPPFFNVSLSQLFAAVRLLACFDLTTPVAISYLTRRSSAILSVFEPFNLQPTGYRPEYLTVENDGRNAIEIFANFDSSLWRRVPRSFDTPTPPDLPAST